MSKIDYTPKAKPAITSGFAGKYASPGFIPGSVRAPIDTTPYHRVTTHVPSRGADNMAPCPKRAAHRYTGTSVLGIAAMHKSNLVPVFNPEAARDTATMRRN